MKNLFKKKEKEKDISFKSYPFLSKIKPKERYVFHSDYFKVDNYYCSIMSFFHTPAATDNFAPFWGINRIPGGLPEGVTTINFEQVRKYGEGWISSHQTTAEGVAEMGDKEQSRAGNNSSKHRARRAKDDLQVIAGELNDGAAYLNVHTRIMVKAPSLETLDESIAKLERLFVDRFGTLHAAAYIGEQRRELTQLFSSNYRKKGKGFHFTSTEYAGSYSLVTHGLEDPRGEYIGDMIGDVNNSAVLFDVNKFSHHVVVATEQYNAARGRAHVADMWGSKLSQAAMLENGRVVHLVLDGANLDNLGPSFEGITSKIDMSVGDVNMFEMFGSVDNELSIFPSQMQKLILMAEQAYETTDADRSVIRGSLEEIATKFYIESGMWYDNAVENRDKLRVTDLPHDHIPKLEKFVTYLDVEYKKLINMSARDDEKVHALSILRTTFKNLLSSNGDLFNTITSDTIDDAATGKRVIYDFSELLLRGKGIAMAQFVNIIGFAVGNLGINDLVIIHGAESIDPSIRDYVDNKLDHLYSKGGRVAYLYNKIDVMVRNHDFNHFDEADYTIFGNMSENTVKLYQKQLGQEIPPDLARLITDKNDALCYIRRGVDNVIFRQYLQLEPREFNKVEKRRSNGLQKGKKRG